MDLAGIGIDITEVSRFTKFRKYPKNKFLENNYSSKELAYCYSFKDPVEHLAGVFAAKEATWKTLNGKMPLSSIEVRWKKNGMPIIWIGGRHNKFVHISISHTAVTAIAIAILEK